MNKTQMTEAFFNPSLADTLMYPSNLAGFENDASYSPVLNFLFLASHNVPAMTHYVARNATNYGQGSGQTSLPIAAYNRLTCGCSNATIEAVNAATGQMVWSHLIPGVGYRGGLTNSGNVVYVTLSSGDVQMLNAKDGTLIKDYYIGGPLNVLASVGATSSGKMEIILPITAGLVSWGTGVPGDIVALTLQNLPAGTTNTITATSTVSASATTTTTMTTVTATGESGVSTTTLYGVAAVAAIFIIATGYLAMRGRKPAP
jgi:outer membrane protein assembly factor BamB